jgi:ABC-type thiamine transport system ATPase subunit
MKLPRAILFDLDDTIFVAFGPAQSQWQRTIAAFADQLGPIQATVIAALNREDRITLLLVEQRVAEALESCDYGYVLETGRVALEGRHDALIADDRVRRAYLGKGSLQR